MKTKKKNVGIVLTTFLLSLFLTTACTSTNTTKSGNNSTHKKNPIVKNSLTIVTATAKQDGQWILVETKMKNNTTSAQNLKPDLFALVSNSTILSPDANSEIPQQIPAKTTEEFRIQFDPKSLEGDVPLRLAYQPIVIPSRNNFSQWENLQSKRRWLQNNQNQMNNLIVPVNLLQFNSQTQAN